MIQSEEIVNYQQTREMLKSHRSMNRDRFSTINTGLNRVLNLFQDYSCTKSKKRIVDFKVLSSDDLLILEPNKWIDLSENISVKVTERDGSHITFNAVFKDGAKFALKKTDNLCTISIDKQLIDLRSETVMDKGEELILLEYKPLILENEVKYTYTIYFK